MNDLQVLKGDWVQEPLKTKILFKPASHFAAVSFALDILRVLRQMSPASSLPDWTSGWLVIIKKGRRHKIRNNYPYQNNHPIEKKKTFSVLNSFYICFYFWEYACIDRSFSYHRMPSLCKCGHMFMLNPFPYNVVRAAFAKLKREIWLFSILVKSKTLTLCWMGPCILIQTHFTPFPFIVSAPPPLAHFHSVSSHLTSIW